MTIVFGGTGHADVAEPNLSQNTTQTSGKFFTLSNTNRCSSNIQLYH